MSSGTDFLPIEEKVEWNLNASHYEPAVDQEMRQLVNRIKSMNDTITAYNVMIHRSMDERKLIMSQTQELHAQIIKYKEQNFLLKRQLQAIGIAALSAIEAGYKTNGDSATPSPVGDKLYLRVHYGDSVCPADSIRYTDLSRGSKKKDKNGNEWDSVMCPNCDAEYIDKNKGKECGVRDHLAKFKCPKLKHLRPVDVDDSRKKAADPDAAGPKKKKQKKVPAPQPDPVDGQQQQATNETGDGTAAAAAGASSDNELDDLEVQVSGERELSPSSMGNIMQFLNES